MAGGVFLLDELDQLLEMSEEGYASEERLQKLLADYPSLMAGDQVNPSDPREWLLVSREISVPSDDESIGRWSLDHLFLDQEAIPTLVEVKRSTDTRVRREVVGQMLDYAANAVTYWSLEKIQSTFESNCEALGSEPQEIIQNLIGPDIEASDFWLQVKTNLQAGRIRMVFLADQIPSELRRIVEFLNEQMDPAEVIAVEVKQYRGGGRSVLVPKVIGQSTAAQQKKSGSNRSKFKWDEATFLERLKADQGDVAETTASRILKWSQNKNLPIHWGEGSGMGSFSPRIIHNGTKYQLFAVWTSGLIEIYFQWLKNKPPFDSKAKRLLLLKKINEVKGVQISEDKIESRPSFKFQDLGDEGLETFLKAYDWVLLEISKT
jgi:hypothetical protein